MSMIKRTITILLLAASLLFAQTTPELGIRSKTPTLKAFTNARIVVSPTKTIERGTMVIEHGVIVAVGPSVTVPRGATVYDLTGKTLYPGFVEPFGQYGVPEAKRARSGWGAPPKYETERIGANAWNGSIHAEKDWGDQFEPDDKAAEELLDLGFTVVQSASLDGVFRGRPVVVTLGEGLPNDLILRRAGHHFVSFDKGSSEQNYPSSLMGSIALVRQTLLDADWYGKAQQAYQNDPTQPRPETNRALAALTGVTSEGVVFESDDELSLARAELIAQEFAMPVVHVGSGFEYSRLDDVKATGRTLILPLAFPAKPPIKEVGDELDVSLATLRHWETAPSNPARLEKAGVRFAFTTHRLKKKADFAKNVRTAIERGLSRTAALSALTVIPAQIAGIDNRVGTLEQGKLANFIITDGDIFEKKSSVYSVWVAGINRREKIDLAQVDFRGTWKLAETWIGDDRRDESDKNTILTLKGDLADLKGDLKMDTVSVKLTDFSVGITDISFAATLDTFGIMGVARYTGRKVGDRLEGATTLGNGVSFNWAFVSVPDTVAKTADEEKEKTKSDSLYTRLTHPNMAFGNETQPIQQTVLVQNATIWTCDDAGKLENSDILFQDGKIKAIGKGLAVPIGAVVINGTGKHVTPGVIDEHSHVAISGGVNEGTHSVTSEVRIGDVINPDDIGIYRELAGGTTICQSLHGSANPIGGQAQVIKFRWGANAEQMKFQAAPPSIKFALGENVKQSNWGERYNTRYPQSRMGVETSIRDAFQAAVEYEKEWKDYNALSRGDKAKRIPPRRDLQLDALVQVKNSQMWVHCHSYVQTEVLMLMRVAESFGFRIGTFTHILEGYKVADEMAAHGAGGSAFSDWWAYKFEVYDAIPYNTCIMADRGVVTSINSDSDELGRHLNQEAAKSVQYCGISQEEALKFATINPAIQLKIDSRVGSLKIGKDADFVIWNGNPLSLYSRCEQTWIDGRKYFDIEEDTRKAERQQIEKNALVQKVLGNDSPEVDYDGSGYKPPERTWKCEDVFDVFRHTMTGKGGLSND